MTASASDANGVTVKANGVSLAPAGGGTFSGSVPLNVGANAISIVATDGGGNTRTVVRNVTRTAAALGVVISSPAANALTNANAVTVSGVASGGTAPYTVNANGTSLTVNAVDGSYSGPVPLTTEGAIAITVTVTDAASGTKSEVVNITRDVTAPVLVVNAPQDGAATTGSTIVASGSVTDPRLSSLQLNGNAITVNADGTFSTTVSLAAGPNTLAFVAMDAATNSTTVTRSIMRNDGLAVSVQDLNPGTTLERDECLTIAVGDDAASECGDLRIVHALPTTRTMNKARAPTLIYNSRHARPAVLIAANVSVDGDRGATELVATVHVGSQQVAAQTISWESTTSGQRRVVVPVVASTAGLTTGAYAYTLQVQAKAGATPVASGSATGTFVIVDRTASAFGAGWWLDGLELLSTNTPAADQKLWVGGDGSTRVYTQQNGSNLWLVTPSVDRVDSLMRVDSAGVTVWRRKLRNGAFVEFDNGGRHVATENRLGHRTTFAQPSDRLESISLPIPAGASSRVYDFNYSTDPGQPVVLQSIDAPEHPGQPRRTILTHQPGTRLLESVTDADNKWVGFKYESDRLAKRRSRSDDTTFFAYDEASLLSQVKLEMRRTGEPDIVTKFCAAEARSLASCASGPQLPEKVYTRFDGPREEAVGDTTVFRLNRFGAPTEIINALGQRTTIERTHPIFPMLATAVERPSADPDDPGRYRVEAVYSDDRGLLESTRAIDPYRRGCTDGSCDAVTQYDWHTTRDAVTMIAPPAGGTLTFDYDALNGNRLWQQDARGAATRVTFHYNESGPAKGLVRAVEQPGGAQHTMRYDGHGNLEATRTAVGHEVRFQYDSVGRPRFVRQQIDSANYDLWHLTSTEYDAMDRVMLEMVDGPALRTGTSTASAAQQVIVEHIRNAEGADSILKRQDPAETRVGVIATTWLYDAAGRKRTEIAPDGEIETRLYDPAGNVESVTNRNGHTIRMTYDRLNRVVGRSSDTVQYLERNEGLPFYFPDLNSTPSSPVAGENPTYPRYGKVVRNGERVFRVPGDSAVFDYDAGGNLKLADNRDAWVRRSYYRNGQLRRDSLYIRTVTGEDLQRHKYGMEHTYDLAGRRTDLKHPTELVAGAAHDGAHYVYDPQTGELSTVRDIQGNEFVYQFNDRAELESIGMPLGVSENYEYDDDRNLTRHIAPTGMNSRRDTRLRYDARGKIVWQGNAHGFTDTSFVTYTGLGHVNTDSIVAYAVALTNTFQQTTGQRFEHDALGNLWERNTFRLHRQIRCSGSPCGSESLRSSTRRTQEYKLGTGRFDQGNTEPPGFTDWKDTVVYDKAGNTVFTRAREDFASNARIEDRASFYAADGKLYAADYRWAQGGATAILWATTFEEYRYDALGRRVWVRARRFCQDGGSFECSLQMVRRTVWDGDAELYEIQMPGGNNTPVDTLENDSGPVQLALFREEHDPNPNYGRVAYTHGLGVDRPLSMVRFRYADRRLSTSQTDIGWQEYPVFSIVPLWNARGNADDGYFAPSPGHAGGSSFCIATNRCVFVDFLRAHDVLSYSNFNTAPVHFQGTLIDNKRDKAGTWYRRNRVYDPQTSRFTQEDPIGLAGGMNLYGFANGDPVNFSDPFGLCANPQDPKCRHAGWNRLRNVLGLGRLPAVATTPPAKTTVGVSITLGFKSATVACNQSSCGRESTVFALPVVGGSFDLGKQFRELAPGEENVEVSIGVSRHLGFTISSTGWKANIGISTPGSPISIALEDLPPGGPNIPRVQSVKPDATYVKPY